MGKEVVASVRDKYQALQGELDERARRLWAASEAKGLGYGGISAVARATGISISTIRNGLRELEVPREASGVGSDTATRRIRRVGGGRHRLTHQDPQLTTALQGLVEPTTRGDPMTPLRWTCKSTGVLADELTHQGHAVSDRSVAALLHELGYSLQANRKTVEGASHPDRDAQFTHINAQVEAFQRRGPPVISIDTKKKELVGDFKNAGREWRPAGDPEQVRVHDFKDEEKGKAIPYGVYDLTQDNGWVNVGVDHDTAEFAVQSIRQWWKQMGCHVYSQATDLLITADGGGSNSSRVRLWKVCVQKLADEIGLRISVCHFPPGTSKWNKIEHRMFCHITRNWRGRPLESLEVIVNLIANTTTKKGLRIQAAVDPGRYAKGIKVEDEQLAQVQIERDPFHGDWNYHIIPRRT